MKVKAIYLAIKDGLCTSSYQTSTSQNCKILHIHIPNYVHKYQNIKYQNPILLQTQTPNTTYDIPKYPTTTYLNTKALHTQIPNNYISKYQTTHIQNYYIPKYQTTTHPKTKNQTQNAALSTYCIGLHLSRT